MSTDHACYWQWTAVFLVNTSVMVKKNQLDFGVKRNIGMIMIHNLFGISAKLERNRPHRTIPDAVFKDPYRFVWS